MEALRGAGVKRTGEKHFAAAESRCEPWLRMDAPPRPADRQTRTSFTSALSAFVCLASVGSASSLSASFFSASVFSPSACTHFFLLSLPSLPSPSSVFRTRKGASNCDECNSNTKRTALGDLKFHKQLSQHMEMGCCEAHLDEKFIGLRFEDVHKGAKLPLQPLAQFEASWGRRTGKFEACDAGLEQRIGKGSNDLLLHNCRGQQ